MQDHHNSSKARRAFSGNFPDSRDDYVARLVETFAAAFHQLGLDVEKSLTERMSRFIYESMSTSARNYHHVQHVFDVIEGNVCVAPDDDTPSLDAIAILAALFHDCIYANIDGGLSRLQKEKLDGAIEESATIPPETGTSTTELRITASSQDKLLSMVVQVFGMEHAQILHPGEGGNEFLSAVIAVRELESILSFPDLVKIAVCIEATIPFRPDDPITGESALEKLFKRLRKLVKGFPVDLSEEECLEAVQRACLVANEDIGNFATPNHALFMDKTWSLLPESNAALRQAYTIFEFHEALFKMHGFFKFVKADLIYQQFRGTPPDYILEDLTQGAAANIVVGSRYLSIKLVSMTFLAALAQLSGGDYPINLFMGELSSASRCFELNRELDLRSIEEVQEDPSIDVNVYRLLAEGRLSETAFDVRQSPLSAYFYGVMGNDQVAEVLEGAKPTFPMSDEVAWKFLKLMPSGVVVSVASVIAEKVPEREDMIRKIVRTIEL